MLKYIIFPTDKVIKCEVEVFEGGRSFVQWARQRSKRVGGGR
jgi:hypothetical protein